MKRRAATHKEELEMYNREKIYDIGFMIVFAILTVWAGYHMPFLNQHIRTLTTLDVLVLIFSVFRLTQIVTTDNVFQWCRDLVFDVDVIQLDPEVKIHREIPTKGFRRELAILLDCPWCISMWLSLATLFAWFTWPGAHIFFYILALSGIAAPMHVFIKKLSQ